MPDWASSRSTSQNSSKISLAMALSCCPYPAPIASPSRHYLHHHGDPFDRMLIVQARDRGLTLLSDDRNFASYEVMTLTCR